MKKLTHLMVIAAFGISSLNAAQVILDDLIVDGSECIGVDCSSAEVFSFDTLRFKENNLRIHFDDTSSSASFPANDWRILINDTINGGVSYFAIEDSTAGLTPFTVEAGADANSLYIDDTGKVGLGTATPAVELHTKDGDTPTLRLEQDGSLGWAPQTWDVAGNETNFFIRDTTNGSSLPFRIKPGAPTNSLYVNSDGNIGLGTSTPKAKLNVVFSGSNTVDDGLSTLALLSANNTDAGKSSDAGFGLVNSREDFQWNFRTLGFNEGFTATKLGTGGGEFIVGSATSDFHDATVTVGGVTIFENGHLVTASSRELKTDIKPLDTQAALEAFDALQPVSYAYKAHADEAVVGFIAEDVPELVAMPSKKSIDSTEIVAVLTSVLAKTRAEIKEKDKNIDILKAEVEVMKVKVMQLDTIQKKVAMMESILTNLALDTTIKNKEKISLK